VKSLLRRVGKLEQSRHFPRAEDLRKPIMDRAIASLTTPDLHLLIEAAETKKHGQAPTVEQLVAMENLRKAFETECLQAGYKSAADFNRKHPVRQAALTSRSRS
jgi:hypothetical protein